MFHDQNMKNTDSIIKEILAKNPELSGVTPLLFCNEPISTYVNPSFVVTIQEMTTPRVQEVSFDTQEGKNDFLVEVDVSISVYKTGFFIKIDSMLPLLNNGSEQLADDLAALFVAFEFDLSSMTSEREIFYIARPVDGSEYITWADEAFFMTEEARKINMTILNAIFSSEENH